MTESTNVEMIPISEIVVTNPRARNAKVHKEITDNIGLVGLKRPITVRRNQAKQGGLYALVCGQGRLESCQMLGETEIAAIVIDADAETGHVMSIVENVARRSPRASETMEQVSGLRNRGYSDAQIAEKIGCTQTWVNNVANLMERGEKRLLAAVEAGHISIHLAVIISRATEDEAQVILLEAYERGDLKGKKVSVVRKILEQRMRSGKKGTNNFTRAHNNRHISPEELAKLYQRDTDHHRLIQKKAEHTQNALLLAQQIFRELFTDKGFCNLLKVEKFTSIPQPLAELSSRSRMQR